MCRAGGVRRRRGGGARRVLNPSYREAREAVHAQTRLAATRVRTSRTSVDTLSLVRVTVIVGLCLEIVSSRRLSLYN